MTHISEGLLGLVAGGAAILQGLLHLPRQHHQLRLQLPLHSHQTRHLSGVRGQQVRVTIFTQTLCVSVSVRVYIRVSVFVRVYVCVSVLVCACACVRLCVYYMVSPGC